MKISSPDARFNKKNSDRRSIVVLAISTLLVTLALLAAWDADSRMSFGRAKSLRFATQEQPAPTISMAWFKGKKLTVTGENFDDGAAILVNHLREKTKNRFEFPDTELIAKKAGTRILPDQIVRLQIQNSNGLLSEEISVYTGCR